MALIIAIPVVLLIGNAILLPLPAPLPFLVVAAVGCAASLYVFKSERLRTQGATELIRLAGGRKFVLYLSICLVVLAEALCLVLGVPTVRWRASLDRTLSSDDPCAIESYEDLSQATDIQKSRCKQNKVDCDRKHARQAAAERVRMCAEVAGRFAAGNLSQQDPGFLESFAAIARRAVEGNLTAADLRSNGPSTMPCTGNEGAGAFWRAYVAFAGKSKQAWESVTETTNLHAELLGAIAGALPDETRKPLQERVERVATAAAQSAKTAGDLSSAKELCDLESALKLEPSPTCAYALGKYDNLKKQEDAAAERKSKQEAAAAEAKRLREEAEQTAKDAREAQEAQAKEVSAARRQAACEHIDALGARSDEKCERLDQSDPRYDACVLRVIDAVAARKKALGCD